MNYKNITMFIDILQNLMQDNGINQRQLSIQSEIPLTTINGWFKANRLPDYCTIKKLAVFSTLQVTFYLN